MAFEMQCIGFEISVELKIVVGTLSKLLENEML